MENLKIKDFGDRAILIEFAQVANEESLSRCLGLREALESPGHHDFGELTAGYGSMLLEFETKAERDAVKNGPLPEVLRRAKPLPPPEGRRHEIPVIYDGPDLESLAKRNGLSVEEVIERHSAREYQVYMVGFSPGFPYLGPLDERLHAPRLDTPRVKVPAGSVGIGGEHTGIYGFPTPGGWWLIGRITGELVSRERAAGEGRADAFLLWQGDRVKFQAVKG